MKFLTKENRAQFGEDYVRVLIKELQAAGKSASGKLMRSIDYRLSDEADAIHFIFDAEDYFNYVDEGRKPGSYPPIQDIAKWARIKGLGKSAAFPIARSIYKFGIKPANIFKKADAKAMNGKIFDDLESNIGENVENEIVKQLEQLNNTSK